MTKVLTFMRGLVTSGASPASVDTFQEPQAKTLSRTARPPSCATGTTPTRRPGRRAKVIGNVGVAPLPTFAGQPYPGYSNIGGWNLYINPHSKNVTADPAFINFITGTEAQTVEATPPFSEIPTNAAVRANPAIKLERRRSPSCPRPSSSPGPLRTPTTPRFPKPSIPTSTRLSPARQPRPRPPAPWPAS